MTSSESDFRAGTDKLSGLPRAKGRGSQFNPKPRFQRLALHADLQSEPGDDQEPLESDGAPATGARTVPTEYFLDDAKSVVSENASPDIPFRYSLNPYRGCAHGCSYCFARPTHEYYDLSAGLDFEAKIFVKQRAPELFRDWLARDRYEPETVAISGVTDCYQPIERQLELTRRCLQVALEARQPIAIVTKNALVTRDVEILREMAALQLVKVAISITSLDQSLIKLMEPRTGSPAAKLRAMQVLASAGIPVHAMVAPVIPGLTDHEIPRILQAAREAGARSASYILLRLPLTVEPVFLEWLARTQPGKRALVESRIRATRGGHLYESEFGVRMRGRGEIADQIGRSFEIFSRRYELDQPSPPLDTAQFRRPVPSTGQRWLF
ncbi:MAG: hypothetical protein RIS70_477 [Planctomycetota bacterium]